MKRTLILGIVAIFIGCGQTEPMPPVEPVQPVEPIQPVEPGPLVHPPVQPIVPQSIEYIHGYRDGYNGNWLSPINWLITNEYRAGWSAGDRDRRSGNPQRIQ